MSPSLLSKLRLVTVDVTGTLIAYKGELGDYYCMAAKSAGMPCPDYERVHQGFKLAYAEMSRRHPCFGHTVAMPNADWWKICVRDSFAKAGYEYDDGTFERIFRRIYATFGSSAPYSVFPDARHFLRWLRGRGLAVGIVSNAEYRYRDVVLPALGLNQGTEWDFGVFSGIAGVEKPDPRIYEAALAAAGGVAPGEALHIGDSLRKDYAPARSLGMHALLLDRFRTAEAESWRRAGAPVLPDLAAAREWLAAGDHKEEAEHVTASSAWGGPAPASVPALVRAHLARRASSADCAAATVAAASPASSVLEELAAEHKGLAKVVLKKGKTQIFRDGSPMVYSGAVDRIIGRPPPKSGDVVLVADGMEKPIGWGLYNSVSMFCVRLMQLEEEARRDPTSALNMVTLLEARISSAVNLRQSLGLPSASTNAYRLINSEGDRLSGLIVDIFADVAVIASSAAWVEKYRKEIQFLVSKVAGINHIKWRPSADILKEEGLEISEQKEPASSCSTVKVMENGIIYLVSFEGQKTGFYADQRENRHFVSLLSKGQRVLDICCYSGGFALHAAKGGADNVIGIDSSGSALDLASENILLNELDPDRISFVKGDATAFMKGAISKNELWDLVILDPPKLAPRKEVLQSASGMYRNLNALAMQVVEPGGLLMTCSCSGAMTQSGMFLKTIQGAASVAGRKVTVLRQAGAACDHPIDPAYPEGQYLSNYLLRVA